MGLLSGGAMRIFSLFLLGVFAYMAFCQYDYINPSNYPDDMKCDTSGMISVFNQHWQGTLQYKVYLPPANPDNPDRYLSPVIDGFLEPEIWSYSDTLVINSWEMAGLHGACTDGYFYGAEDLHVIWRFMYNHDGLFVSAQIHDDIHDVDSLNQWYLDDCLEIMVDPWDWGDFAVGNWTTDPPIFRRYYSNLGQVIPGGGVGLDNSHLSYFHLIKRLNEEPYLAGLLHGISRGNYNRGQEATNFTKGNPDCMDIDFAVAYQGVDNFFREVYHAEFLFPYPTPQASNPSELWAALEEGSGGFFDQEGLPRDGTLFKMSFWHSDDDMLGPDGSTPRFNQLGTMRWPEFHQEASGHDHWSDTKYYMTFEYQPYIGMLVTVPFSGDKGHGDSRLIGPWISVSASDSNRYDFTEGGTIKIDGSTYFYDYADINGGEIKVGVNPIANYTVSLNETNRYLDTLVISGASINETLVRYLAFGWPAIEGRRWIESQLTYGLDDCKDSSFYKFTPVWAAREFRFVPSSRFTTPGYEDAFDSMRVYDFDSGIMVSDLAYTATTALLGRNKIYCTYRQTKLVNLDDVTAPLQLAVTFGNGDSAIFQEIPVWDLCQIGETNNSTDPKKNTAIVFNATNRVNAAANTTPAISLIVVSKYLAQGSGAFKMNIGTLTEYRVYPDVLVRVADSNKAQCLTPAFRFNTSVDSFAFTSYDPASSTGSGEYRHNSATAWFDSSWVVTTRYLYISDIVTGGTDTFYFRDTVQVQVTNPSAPNYVDTNTCPVIYTKTSTSNSIVAMALTVFPNPFNPSTTVEFSLPAQEQLVKYTVLVYDIRGRLVRTLASGTTRNSMQKRVIWNGMDNTGKTVGSGMYLLCLAHSNKVLHKSMVFVK